MQRLYLILAIIAIFVLGLIRILFAIRLVSKKKLFAIDFLNKFREFLEILFQDHVDGELYQWLKLKSSEMQKQINAYGISCNVKPAGANYIIKDYQVILNGISNLVNKYYMFGDLPSMGRNILRDEANSIDDTILTYLGELDTEYNENLADAKNPVIWLREGIRAIVILPISLMFWTGLIHYRTYSNLSNN